MPGPLKDARRERFAQLLATGMTQIKAYEQAGYSPRRQDAHRTKERPDVAARILELKEQHAAAAGVTVDSITQMLLKTRADADAAGDHTNARQAAMDLAKLHGLLIDRSKIDSNNTQYVISDEPMSAEAFAETYTDGVLVDDTESSRVN